MFIMSPDHEALVIVANSGVVVGLVVAVAILAFRLRSATKAIEKANKDRRNG